MGLLLLIRFLPQSKALRAGEGNGIFQGDGNLQVEITSAILSLEALPEVLSLGAHQADARTQLDSVACISRKCKPTVSFSRSLGEVQNLAERGSLWLFRCPVIRTR